MRKLLLGLVLIFGFICAYAGNHGDAKRVLIYTKNGEGYVHENIAASVAATMLLLMKVFIGIP